jgi:hypothetical protein
MYYIFTIGIKVNNTKKTFNYELGVNYEVCELYLNKDVFKKRRNEVYWYMNNSMDESWGHYAN